MPDITYCANGSDCQTRDDCERWDQTVDTLRTMEPLNTGKQPCPYFLQRRPKLTGREALDFLMEVLGFKNEQA